MKPKIKVWVVFQTGLKFGDGRARLLDVIHELGSLQEAVERFDMSYRNAWGYLRDLEASAGFAILQRAPGRRPKGGMKLTARGREFLRRYWRFRRGLDDVVARRFARSFAKTTK